MGTVFLYLTLCAWGAADQCHEVRTHSFTDAFKCSREGARRVNANNPAQSGHFIFIECRPS